MTLVWSRRLGGVGGDQPSPIEDALDARRIERVGVGPLSVGAIHHIIRDQLSETLARPTLLKLHETSGGNPFYALELVRALRADGARRDPTQPLLVPERLEELVSARLGDFTGPTREVLVLVSAHARLSLAQLARAGIDAAALDPALGEGVIELAHGSVRFTHPLLASVLYQGLSRSERQRAHGRLAELVEDPVTRARHLALSTDTPDATLAAALEEAAATVVAQGAPMVAAELGEHALRLTPPEDAGDRGRRAAGAARAHLAAGDAERGRRLANDLLARVAVGAERAEALVLVAEGETEDLQRTVRRLDEALREPEAPPALRAAIHQRLSLLVRFSDGLDAAERHAHAAVELASRIGDDALRAAALGGLALIRFNSGRRGALQLAEQAYELAVRVAAPQAVIDAGFSLAHVLVWSVQLDPARTLLETLHRDWNERDERVAAHALWYLALVELRAGRLSTAGKYAEEARALSVPYVRDEAESPSTPFPLALVAAHRGELEQARELLERILQLAEMHGSRFQGPTAALAVVDLWGADPQAAVARFDAAERLSDAGDAADPGMRWWVPEQVEALLELGRVDDAVARLDAWEADGLRLGRDWVLAHAERCRGLVAAALDDVEQAVPLLTEAVSRHEAVEDPFGRARALLALGVVKRRLRQKRASRDAIAGAVALFEQCGAEGWAEKARSELGRIGGRRREEGLTAAEQRVAALVVEGRTNREVAAALFLGERTVEAHLSHIYAKLGVRSRTELARALDSAS